MAASGAEAPSGLVRFYRRGNKTDAHGDDEKEGPAKWSMGVLNDRETLEVPGSVLLLASHRNEPLGLRNAPARTSHSSIPAGILPLPPATEEEKKKTRDGNIILEPQPDDSANDPLNWPEWRRDSALLSLGLYCMIGGGITPLLAAGFTNVAEDYGIEVETVALTTGLYMMGLGLGSVIASPTAIIYGKRPVYLVSAVLFIATSVWCAVSPNFTSLVLARIFQGISVSPVECLPSATIAEIFFLHERAYRIGIYTLLLLGGKNLVPLVSAAVIQRLGWRWAFWIVSMVVGLGFVLLFFFVPETFWDRTPSPKSRKPSKRPSFLRRLSSRHGSAHGAVHTGNTVVPLSKTQDFTAGTPERHEFSATQHKDVQSDFATGMEHEAQSKLPTASSTETSPHHRKNLHVGFEPSSGVAAQAESVRSRDSTVADASTEATLGHDTTAVSEESASTSAVPRLVPPPGSVQNESLAVPSSLAAKPVLSHATEQQNTGSGGYFTKESDPENPASTKLKNPQKASTYTHVLRDQPAKSFVQRLRPFHGRLNNDKWLKVMIRPFVLFSYPSVLWSAAVYSCSIGWLIVVSESIAMIYRNKATYNFSALQTGLVYLSPFIGGILGTAVAGKVSDIIVKAMARRNGGLYEPEFRLIMAGPVLVSTVIGLMGFGWSAEERDSWIVPTIFFGIISFGCSLGSTTSITFCVDSYRQYAGEALVTLNFSKNIFHGLVFSLFVTHWISADGSKAVFIWIGVIQLLVLLTSIPMYIYGKRARMWTVRKNFMEKL